MMSAKELRVTKAIRLTARQTTQRELGLRRAPGVFFIRVVSEIFSKKGRSW
jgi:hypothetical protein